MIVSGDDPIQGRKAQSQAVDSTINVQSASPKRSRLAHLFELDERHLIDLQVEQELRDGKLG